ncbi:MAG: F0F1 ATP synthase subunit A [Candidatus Latescibacterota bacterium]|nr:MAG: F0F1 ATP synthase subunit A [Candidatus Latescibacterota bacterium]
MTARSAFASSEGGHELPNFITVIYHYAFGTSVGEFLHKWENLIFSLLVVGLLVLVARLASKNPKLIPSGLQNFVELVVEQLENFIVGILGPRGKKFVPFLGTLFLYILCMNYLGLIPLMKAPTANLNQTLALAVCVFLYVQYTGLKENGPVGYIKHLLGSPESAMQWVLSPLMFVIHIIGELAKPMSLSLRLFGNITGEDILIFIFVGLGVGMLAFSNLPIGVPLQIPFYFLALLTGFIQALVFMLLSTIYFAMMLPHDEEEHH